MSFLYGRKEKIVIDIAMVRGKLIKYLTLKRICLVSLKGNSNPTTFIVDAFVANYLDISNGNEVKGFTPKGEHKTILISDIEDIEMLKS